MDIHKIWVLLNTLHFLLNTPHTPHLILHHNMVGTTNIAPSYLCTTTIAQHSTSIVQMLGDLPSNLRLARNLTTEDLCLCKRND